MMELKYIKHFQNNEYESNNKNQKIVDNAGTTVSNTDFGKRLQNLSFYD